MLIDDDTITGILLWVVLGLDVNDITDGDVGSRPIFTWRFGIIRGVGVR